MCDRCVSPPDAGLSRRHLFGAGAALAAAIAAPRLAAAADPAPPTVAPEAALQRLREGAARYAANAPVNRDYSAGRAARASAQYPFAAIVSCADSRVAPELIYDQGPGDLFVVRVAGNFVNPDGLASLEYGVKFLGVGLIVVLGHSGCGAIDATIKVIRDKVTLPGHLPGLIDALRPGVQAAMARHPADLLAEATAENVRHTVRVLSIAKPILAPRVAAGSLKVVGSIYDIGTGSVAMV